MPETWKVLKASIYAFDHSICPSHIISLDLSPRLQIHCPYINRSNHQKIQIMSFPFLKLISTWHCKWEKSVSCHHKLQDWLIWLISASPNLVSNYFSKFTCSPATFGLISVPLQTPNLCSPPSLCSCSLYL